MAVHGGAATWRTRGRARRDWRRRRGGQRDGRLAAAAAAAAAKERRAPAPRANAVPVKDMSRVKFEIQVYKMKDERYMIDFQRMDGGVMTCMDAAAAMMKNLRLT